MRDIYNFSITNHLVQQLNFLVLSPQDHPGNLYPVTAPQQSHYQWPTPVLLVPAASPATSSVSSPISTPSSSSFARPIIGRTEPTSSPASADSSWSSSSSGSSPTSTHHFPLNTSLDEDIQGAPGLIFKSENKRYSRSGFTPLDEFRQIGRDYEYCPEEPDVMAQTKANQKRKKKNKKPLATECVFCKNNDQPQSVYKSHILKNADGDVVCPILSQYTCEYCGATGRNAHTRMYCSYRNNAEVPVPKSFQTPENFFHR